MAIGPANMDDYWTSKTTEFSFLQTREAMVTLPLTSKMRTSYTVEKKLEIIAWHKSNGSSYHKTAKHFTIDRKTLRLWVSRESHLLENNVGQAKKRRCLGSGRKPLSEELDDFLFEFLEKERTAGRAVSNKRLQQEAKTIADRLGLKEFKASDRFISNWKRRFNVVHRVGTNDSQKTPEELSDEIGTFHAAVKEKRQKNDYTDFNIGNMDQTMVRFDCPSKRTNHVKGESTIRITNTGCAKRGFTVALCARASGHKMPAFCILKEPGGRIPPKVWKALRIPKNVRVACSANGWMTSESMEAWIRQIWGPNEDDVRRLLILDKAPIHVKPEVRDSLQAVDTDLVLIPGGCTRLVQPADVVWNRPFKAKLTACWEEFMTMEQKTPKGNLKRPTRQNVIDWVSVAWETVTEEMIRASFKSCGVSTSLDGSENGLFNENLSLAVKPAGDELLQELAELLFDDSDSESFAGFSDSESEL